MNYDEGYVMEDRQVNIPLLRKAVEWAEAEAAKPAELCGWYQPLTHVDAQELGRQTECGTCYCIAGYVVALQRPDVYERYATDRHVSICDTARDELGLPAAHHLFAMDNTIADVRRIAEELAGERL